MNSTWKRSFAMVLCLVMVLGMLPVNAFATECSHSYSEAVTKEASCTETGVKTYTCGSCGNAYTEEIAAASHSYSAAVTAPTCEAAGYTTYTCACGDSYTSDEVAATGHSYGEDNKCTACGAEKPEEHTHSYDEEVSNTATCTEAGVKTTKCSCGETTETESPAKGHSYVDGVCACGAKEEPAPTCNCEIQCNEQVNEACAVCMAGGTCIGTPTTDEPEKTCEEGCWLPEGHDGECEIVCQKNQMCVLDNGHEGVCVGFDGVTLEDYVAKIGETSYATLDLAINAANGMTGDVTVYIYGKVEYTANTPNLTGNYDSISFVGVGDTEAEIYLAREGTAGYISGDGNDCTVNFDGLTLSKNVGSGAVYDAAHMNSYFTVYRVGAVNYKNCKFPTGVCVQNCDGTFNNCEFSHTDTGKYSLWVYENANVKVTDSKFTGARGVKMYSETAANTKNHEDANNSISISNTSFEGLTKKPAIVLTYGESVTLSGNTQYPETGVFELDADGDPDGASVTADISDIACVTEVGDQKVDCGVLVDGKIYTTVADAAEAAEPGSEVTIMYSTEEEAVFPVGTEFTYPTGVTAPNVTAPTPVAKIGDVPYGSLADAIKAASAMPGTVEIVLEEGTYTDPINITNDAVGNTNARPDIVIKPAEGAKVTIAGTVTLGYYAKGTGSSKWNGKVSFKNITFDHAESAKHSIDVQSLNGVELIDCTIIGDGEYGIGSASGNDTGASAITGCTFEDAGMQILGNFGTGLVIDDCDFEESHINVQAGNGVTVKNSTFNNTLASANVDDSFYVIRSNDDPLNVQNCTFNIDSTVAADAVSDEWAVLWQRKTGNTQWTVSDCTVNFTAAAMAQSSLLLNKNGTTTEANKPGRVTFTNLSGSNVAALIAKSEGYLNANGAVYVDGKPIDQGTLYVSSKYTGKTVGEDLGDGKYFSINAFATVQDAINAASEGATVTLLNDVTLTEAITIEKAITLDLNSKTITGNAGADALTIKADTTIKNGSITADDELIVTYANLALENVSLTSGKYYLAIEVMDGAETVTLTDCTVDGPIKGYYTAVVEIKSGTYKVTESYFSNYMNATCAISGGTFHYAIEEADCAPGYTTVDNGNGTYTVKYAPACFVDADKDGVLDEGEIVYATLDQVFENHTEGEVNVVLTSDIVAKSQVDTDVDAVYNFTTNVAGGVKMDFLYADKWNYVQKMSIGENITLNAPYLLAWTDFDLYGTVNTDYYYSLGCDTTVHEGGVLNVTTGNATVQVKNAAMTVKGTVNAGTLNVWAGNSSLTVSGENAKVEADWLDCWDGVNTVLVEDGATLETGSMQVRSGNTLTVDGATLSSGGISLGYAGGGTGTLTVKNGAYLELTDDGVMTVPDGGVYSIDESSSTNIVAMVASDGTTTYYTTLQAVKDAGAAPENVTLIGEGPFDINPSDYLDEGYQGVETEDGWYVEEMMSSGGEYYESLDDMLEDGVTSIEIPADTKIPDNYTISDNYDYEDALTINANGNPIMGTGSIASEKSLIINDLGKGKLDVVMENGGTVEFKDGKATFTPAVDSNELYETVEVNGYTWYMERTEGKASSMTIDGASFTFNTGNIQDANKDGLPDYSIDHIDNDKTDDDSRDNIYYLDTRGNLVFKCNGFHKLFTEAWVTTRDEKVTWKLSGSDYSIKDGCTELTLSYKFLRDLDKGKYTLHMKYADGGVAEDGYFIVDDAPAQADPTNYKTGDSIFMAVSVMTFSAAALAVLLMGKKKMI